jgi:hypothetical protein
VSLSTLCLMISYFESLLPLLVDLLHAFRLPHGEVAQVTSHHKHELLPQKLILLHLLNSQLSLLDILDESIVVVGTHVLGEVILDARDQRVLDELH